MIEALTLSRWAVQWHSENRLDGERQHFLCENCVPVLFKTRAEARRYASTKFGYIKNRPDLRAEPHGWKVPRPVMVSVSVAPA